jgi:hypothetical protein
MAILLAILITLTISSIAIGAALLRIESEGIETTMGGCGFGVFGALALLGYSAYRWLRTGEGITVSVRDAIEHFPFSELWLKKVSWIGLQDLNDAYLQSNLIWSLVAVPLAALFVYLTVSERIADNRPRKPTKRGSIQGDA